jgi:hypothetical protein
VHVVARVAKFDLVAGITHLIVTASPQRFWHSNGADPWLRCARQVFLERERPKTELKSLMPEDAKEAIGHGHLEEIETDGARFRALVKAPATSGNVDVGSDKIFRVKRRNEFT